MLEQEMYVFFHFSKYNINLLYIPCIHSFPANLKDSQYDTILHVLFQEKGILIPKILCLRRAERDL
jgi:hypothetical protein